MSSLMPKHQTRNKDRISALPDALICHILSSLRTVEVLETMVLSKRWKNMWASVSNLDFDFKRDFGRVEDIQVFIMFVSRVLYMRDSSDIKKFRLVISSIGYFRVFDDWMYTAVRRNVVELDLHMLIGYFQYVELPECIFMCKTLRVLKLNLGRFAHAEPPTSGSCFPSLKFLHVTVFNPVMTTMQNLFSRCPVLEDLTIDGTIDVYLFGIDGNFKISAPELKMLRISLEINQDPIDVYINSPKLETIDLKRVGLTNFFLVGSAKSLVNANIAFRERSEFEVASNCAMALLDQVSNVKSLSLSAHSMENWHLPEFGNVIVNQLTLVFGDCSCWELLPGFLKNAPNLEDFFLEDRTEGCEEFSELHWSLPEDMPICFSSHLKTISLKGFKGRRVEMEMVKFLLNNGHLLKKMTIVTGPRLSYSKQQELYKEFMMFHRATTCHIEFVYADASLGSTSRIQAVI